jgi:hypothetical protein
MREYLCRLFHMRHSGNVILVGLHPGKVQPFFLSSFQTAPLPSFSGILCFENLESALNSARSRQLLSYATVPPVKKKTSPGRSCACASTVTPSFASMFSKVP